MKKVLDERFRDRIKTECISREDAENLYSNESADKLLAYRTILGEKYRGLVSERDRVSNQLTSGAKLTKWAQDEYVKDRLTLWDITERLNAIDDLLYERAMSPSTSPVGSLRGTGRGRPPHYSYEDTYEWYDELRESEPPLSADEIIDKIITRHANKGRGTADTRTIENQLQKRKQ